MSEVTSLNSLRERDTSWTPGVYICIRMQEGRKILICQHSSLKFVLFFFYYMNISGFFVVHVPYLGEQRYHLGQ